jgi:hypothetical protein
MNTFQPVAFLSAERSNLDRYENQDRTARLRNRLLQLGLGFEGVTGVYKGTKEVAFMVVTSDFDAMRKLAAEFEQEAIMTSDANRMSTLHFASGEKMELGKLRQIDKNDAVLLDNYTIVEYNGKEYFYATSKQT